MAKISITADTVAGTLQINVDGTNISNIYDISVYKRDASPYYDPDEEDEMAKLEVCMSSYEKTDGIIVSKRTTFAKDQTKIEDIDHTESDIVKELSELFANRL